MLFARKEKKPHYNKAIHHGGGHLDEQLKYHKKKGYKTQSMIYCRLVIKISLRCISCKRVAHENF